MSDEERQPEDLDSRTQQPQTWRLPLEEQIRTSQVGFSAAC